MLAFFSSIEGNLIGVTPFMEFALDIVKRLFNSTIVCSRRINAIRIQIVRKDDFLEKTFIDCETSVLEEHVPQGRSSNRSLENHVPESHRLGRRSAHN